MIAQHLDSPASRPARHAIGDEFLLDYAAGTAPKPVAVLIASHAALNPESRATLARLNATGGALLDRIAPTTISAAALNRMLDRLGPQDSRPSVRPSPADAALPAPLQPYVPGGIEALDWRSRGWGISEAVLPGARPSPYRMSLLRIRPGGAIPRHSHRGIELVLVLEGGFTDQRGRYVRGDVCAADETITHRPVADPDGACLCLAVTRGPVRLTGLLGLLLGPFIRH